MKLKEGLLLEEIGGRIIGVTCGEAATKFNGMVTSNPVAEHALRLLSAGDISVDELVDALFARFDASRERISQDVNEWVESLRQHGLIDE